MARKKEEQKEKSTKRNRRTVKEFIKDNLPRRERRRKVKAVIFENSLEKLDNNFIVRITDNKIIISDEETLLEFTPKEMGEVVIERDGEKVSVSIEKEVKE